MIEVNDMSTIYLFQPESDDSVVDQLDAELSDRKPKKRYCCAVCNAPITDDRYQIQINGQHQFTKTNPQNHSFTFGCFSDAVGCKRSGQLTEADTWFSGYSWRFAHCKNCSAQLGWQFSGEMMFYGLILEQLIDCPEDE